MENNNNLRNAFTSVINKKNKEQTDYNKRLQEHLERRKSLADAMVERLLFLQDYGFKVYSRQFYDDARMFHFDYEVVIIKPNGDHGAILYPCTGEYVCYSYQVYPEGTTGMATLGRFYFKTWEDLTKAIAYTLC